MIYACLKARSIPSSIVNKTINSPKWGVDGKRGERRASPEKQKFIFQCTMSQLDITWKRNILFRVVFNFYFSFFIDFKWRMKGTFSFRKEYSKNTFEDTFILLIDNVERVSCQATTMRHSYLFYLFLLKNVRCPFHKLSLLVLKITILQGN